MDVPVWSYAFASASFLALTGYLLRKPVSTLTGVAAILASLTTAVWAAFTARELLEPASDHLLIQILEVLRASGWLMLLAAALPWMRPVHRAAVGYLIGALCILCGVTVATLGPLPIGDKFTWLQAVPAFGYLVLTILGLALVENLFRNATSDQRWAIKFLCFSVGGIFAYNFYLYTDSLLFRRIDFELLAARGVIEGFAAPLLAVWAARSRLSGTTIVASHKFMFYSTTFIGAGIYLLLMSAVGEYVRRYGGSWGRTLQVVFLFGTFLVLLIPLFSGSFRAYLRVVIGKNLFGYKYDYREEWLRFIRTISAGEPESDLPIRVIRGVADILDSPEGAIWLNREPNRYSLTAAWNASRWRLNEMDVVVTGSHPMIAFLGRTAMTVNVEEQTVDTVRYAGLVLPGWLAAIERAWLIVPLVHKDRLLGFMVLGRPRAPRGLNWEDFDLLNTVARQAASYLAQHEADLALSEARQFEAFNRHFAFIIHDIKNLSSGLSLIISGAARHMGNPDFQADLLQTIRGSVERVDQLLRRLSPHSVLQHAIKSVELEPVLRAIVAGQAPDGPRITLCAGDGNLSVKADSEQLTRVLRHLVQNAVEATGSTGHVAVRLSRTEEVAILEVQDDGPGMDPEFVRNDLFRPFRTTKDAGYGIGAYEVREFARSLGGGLDVMSTPGQGTIMRLSLPLSHVNVPSASPLH